MIPNFYLVSQKLARLIYCSASLWRRRHLEWVNATTATCSCCNVVVLSSESSDLIWICGWPFSNFPPKICRTSTSFSTWRTPFIRETIHSASRKPKRWRYCLTLDSRNIFSIHLADLTSFAHFFTQPPWITLFSAIVSWGGRPARCLPVPILSRPKEVRLGWGGDRWRGRREDQAHQDARQVS